MASRKNDLARIGGFLAFIALFVSGIAFAIRKICEIFEWKFDDGGLLARISGIALVVSVIISGYIYLSSTKLKLVWHILFWIFAVLAILGFIL